MKPKIAFQGEPGANGDEACRTHFPDYEPLACATFEEAFEAIRSGAAKLGLIPVENSTAGRVADVHHLLPSSGLFIIGERFKPIRFQLMANKGVTLGDLKTVVSMPIALAQCRKVISKLGLAKEGAGDTAGAAKALSEHPDPTKAAVAPRLAAQIYGLDILMEDIEDEKHNTTRFLVMSPEEVAAPDDCDCITSFVFRVRNIPAALYKAMGGFATNGINMIKLESYMENGVFAATMFYCEVEGRPEDKPLERAFEELQFYSDHFKVLGTYAVDGFRKGQRG